MNEKIRKVLEIWHEHFADEANQYSEYEESDIEYFVGCMLYNRFAFSKALETMKTMDLSYDFLQASGDSYDEVKTLIDSIEFSSEEEKLDFLLEFIAEARAKYTPSELYLLNRLYNHIITLQNIYEGVVEAKQVDFLKAQFGSNPLM